MRLWHLWKLISATDFFFKSYLQIIISKTFFLATEHYKLTIIRIARCKPWDINVWFSEKSSGVAWNRGAPRQTASRRAPSRGRGGEWGVVASPYWKYFCFKLWGCKLCARLMPVNVFHHESENEDALTQHIVKDNERRISYLICGI